jgi:hypothetical protein
VSLGFLQLLLELLDVDLAVGQALFAAKQLCQLGLELVLAGEDAFLELRHLAAALLERLLGLRLQAYCLLSRLDLSLAAEVLGLALRLGDQLVAASCCLAEAAAVLELEPEREQRRSENETDGDSSGDEHGRSSWFAVPPTIRPEQSALIRSRQRRLRRSVPLETSS